LEVVVAFIHASVVVSDDWFTGFLVVVAVHPEARISPIAVNKANGTTGFIEGSGTGRMFLIW
jgi:hypothetical protein